MRAEEMKDAIYVTMEILSTWGHRSWVGLTEIEFFDLDNTKLYVSPHDVDIRNTDTPGDLGLLVNRDLAVSGGGTGASLGLVFPCVISAHTWSVTKLWVRGGRESAIFQSFIWVSCVGA